MNMFAKGSEQQVSISARFCRDRDGETLSNRFGWRRWDLLNAGRRNDTAIQCGDEPE